LIFCKGSKRLLFHWRTSECFPKKNSLLLEFIQFCDKGSFYINGYKIYLINQALQFPNLKSTYAQREGGDDISAEELLKMVEEDADF